MTLIVSTFHTVEMHQRGGWKGGTLEELTFRLRRDRHDARLDDVDRSGTNKAQQPNAVELLLQHFRRTLFPLTFPLCTTAVLCPTDSRQV